MSLYEHEALALERIDAELRASLSDQAPLDWHVPSLIDEEDIVRCGYLSGFPAQLTVAGTLDPCAYEPVASGRALTAGDVRYRRKFLTPAACLNVYPMLARCDAREGMVITTRATVFRHEATFEALLRLWEFPVREFVFAGEENFVLAGLRDATQRGLEMAERLGIAATIRPASDHFYPTLQNRVRRAMQVKLAMKSELVARVKGEELPLASFNYHRTHFSGPFGFDHANRVVTGCVGFGLHRWLAACSSGGEQ